MLNTIKKDSHTFVHRQVYVYCINHMFAFERYLRQTEVVCSARPLQMRLEKLLRCILAIGYDNILSPSRGILFITRMILVLR